MTQVILQQLPVEALNVLRLIGGYADQKRIPCYLVGGVVRDLILGKENLDLDIVVESNAIEFCKPLAQKYQTAFTVYPRFKTATLAWPNHLTVDFSSARKEIYPTSGSLPVVEEGTLRDDIFRRDFTINAMALCLNQERWGALVDMCHGQDDLKSKIIRVFHAKSFQDDPTRILRAIRFQQRYQFKFANETEKFLKHAISERLWTSVTAGRYFEEFKKVLKESCVVDCLRYLHDLDALSFLGTDFQWTKEKEDQLKGVRKILEWMVAKGVDVEDVSLWLVYFIILIGDCSVDAIQELVSRISLSRHDSKKVISFKLEQEIVKRLDARIVRPSQVYNVLKSISLEELVVFLLKTQGQSAEACIQNYLTQYRNVRLNLKGDDLMRMGMRDGKRIGATLQYLLERKIDRGAATKEEEERLLEEIDFI